MTSNCSGEGDRVNGGKRKFKVPIKGYRGETDTISVYAKTSDQAFEKAEEKAERRCIKTPVTAIEARDTVNRVTHRR